MECIPIINDAIIEIGTLIVLVLTGAILFYSSRILERANRINKDNTEFAKNLEATKRIHLNIDAFLNLLENFNYKSIDSKQMEYSLNALKSRILSIQNNGLFEYKIEEMSTESSLYVLMPEDLYITVFLINLRSLLEMIQKGDWDTRDLESFKYRLNYYVIFIHGEIEGLKKSEQFKEVENVIWISRWIKESDAIYFSWGVINNNKVMLKDVQ